MTEYKPCNFIGLYWSLSQNQGKIDYFTSSPELVLQNLTRNNLFLLVINLNLYLKTNNQYSSDKEKFMKPIKLEPLNTLSGYIK